MSWVQVDPSLNRDDILQFFVNTDTKNRVYGRTDGTLSDHIHLRYQDGSNSGLNLDPVSGDISRDGNVLGDMAAVAVVLVEAAVGGAIGATDAAVKTAKYVLVGPDGSQHDLTGLIFPPVTPQP